MATLKLPAGKVYVQRRKPSQTVLAPVRAGHAHFRGFYDQFKRRKHVPPKPTEIPRSNTPLGKASRPANRFAKNGKPFKPSNQEIALRSLPIDIIRQTVANIVRKDLGLRMERLAHPPGYIDESRVPRRKSRAPRISQMERGDTPEIRRGLKLLRKAGII